MDTFKAEKEQAHNLFPQHLHFSGKARFGGHNGDAEVSIRVLIGANAETDAAIQEYGVSYTELADMVAAQRCKRMTEQVRGIDPRPLVVAKPPHALVISPEMGSIYVFTDCDGECAALATDSVNRCAKQAYDDMRDGCAKYCPEYCDDAGSDDVEEKRAEYRALCKLLAGLKPEYKTMEHAIALLKINSDSIKAASVALQANLDLLGAEFGALQAKYGALQAKYGALQAKYGAL